MLVLSRMSGESIVIGDEIVVTVVEVRGDKVKLGISAPNRVPVHRDEIYRKVSRGPTPASRILDDLR